MITERSIKLLSRVMLISANRIKVSRLWLTCFEDRPIRILTFAWWMLKTRKTMVSWQAFPSLPPRAPLAFLSHLKLPFPSLSNACHAGYCQNHEIKVVTQRNSWSMEYHFRCRQYFEEEKNQTHMWSRVALINTWIINDCVTYSFFILTSWMMLAWCLRFERSLYL